MVVKQASKPTLNVRWVRRGSSRGLSRHRGLQEDGLEGTCGLGGGRGTHLPLGDNLGENLGNFNPLLLPQWHERLLRASP